MNPFLSCLFLVQLATGTEITETTLEPTTFTVKKSIELEVTLNDGSLLMGKFSENTPHKTMEYTGIPYAEPPIGTKRFQKAVKKEPWTDVFHADKKPKMCPNILPRQMANRIRYNEGVSDEDCLTLNVIVPQNTIVRY